MGVRELCGRYANAVRTHADADRAKAKPPTPQWGGFCLCKRARALALSRGVGSERTHKRSVVIAGESERGRCPSEGIKKPALGGLGWLRGWANVFARTAIRGCRPGDDGSGRGGF
jgi:hypothetical protein